MKIVRLKSVRDFDEWRAAARALLLTGTPPHEVRWEEGGGSGDLFAAPAEPVAGVTRRAVGVVPRRFLDLARVAFFHEDPQRLALLYRLLFRLQKDRSLIETRSDPDAGRLYRMVAEIRDDVMRSKTEAGSLLRHATHVQARR
jgi:DNA polymerase